jgi:hypothetical protein
MLARGNALPTHNYWTADDLKYAGSGSGACAVSVSGGTQCNTPMRGAFLLAAPRGFGLRQAFMRVCDKVGLSGRRFHDLRHLFVTSLFKAGAPAPAVQAVVLRRRPR